MLFVNPFFSSVSDAKLSLFIGGAMGKYVKRKCAMTLCMNGIAHGYSLPFLFRIGKRRAAVEWRSASLRF